MTTEQIKAELFDLDQKVKKITAKANEELTPLGERQQELMVELEKAEEKK